MAESKTSFNAGIWSENLYGRYELPKYLHHAREAKNFVILPHGPATICPGFQYITEVRDSEEYARIIPFEYSAQEAYILVFNDAYIRFLYLGGLVQTVDSDTKLLLHFGGPDRSTTITDSGDTGHTVTASGGAKVRTNMKKFGTGSCRFDGTNAKLTIPDHADFNFGSGTFTIDFWVKFVDLPSDGDNIPLFHQYASGSSQQRFHLRNVSGTYNLKFVSDDSYAGGNQTVDEDWSGVTTNTWYHIALIRGWGGNANDVAICVDGSILGSATTLTETTLPNVAASVEIGTASSYTPHDMYGWIDEYRVSKGVARWTANFTPPTTEYPAGDSTGTTYELSQAYTDEQIRALDYTQSADIMYLTHRDVAQRKLTRSAINSWSNDAVSFTNPPAAWTSSSSNGYPAAVTFFDDRSVWGGNNSSPDTIWFSEVGNYEKVGLGSSSATADGPFSLNLSARKVNEINWLASGRRLLAGTGGAEWWLSGPSDSEPITYSDKIARKDSDWGSSNVKPVEIGDTVFYIQKNKNTIREMQWDDTQSKYASRNLSVLADHLFKGYEIQEMAFQQSPYQILWCIRDDGVLLGLTYMPEHEVLAWHYHMTDGEFESCAVIPGTDYEDHLYVVVKRTIDGSIKRYVERLNSFTDITALADAKINHSGLTYEGTATTTISGLDHLEGETVAILADGVVVDNKTVSSGSITLDAAAEKVHIGLGFNADLETHDMGAQDQREGSMVGRIKRITNTIIDLKDSQGGQFGPDADNLNDIHYDDTTALSSGPTDDMEFPGGHSKTATVFIRQSDPLPITVRAITVEFE